MRVIGLASTYKVEKLAQADAVAERLTDLTVKASEGGLLCIRLTR
jgi:hypothetical protein